MALKTNIETLLQKPMSRQQFLKAAFAALLAVVGVSRMLDSLVQTQNSTAGSNSPVRQAGSAYGSSVYEGVKR